MIHLFWNCHGLGSDTVVRALHGQIREHRPSMIFLSETKMKDHRIAKVRRRMGYVNGFDMAPVGTAGGLSLWWDDLIQVDVIDSSKHYIDARCSIAESQTMFRFTGVYGTSYRAENEEFWRGMIQNFSPDRIPWICGGDFNEVLWDHEKAGGASFRYNSPRYLEEFMNKAEIMDLGFNGQNYTWRGIRNGQLVEARLDRSLVNASWLSSWPNSMVINGTCRGSDHSPVLVKFGLQPEKRKRLFRFEAFWTKKDECRDIVRGAWNVDRDGNPLERWNSKINFCRAALINWSSEKFKNRGRQIKKLTDQLGVLQQDWRGHSKEIEALEVELDQLCKHEECYWLHRSRVQWLKEKDANTKFFHQSTMLRRRRNNVVSLKNNNGN
ncbi:hypothetical protein ACFX11_027427 [Malus domestica]